MINPNINKQYQQTAGLVQRLINNTHLLSVGVIVAEKFCLEKCVFVVYKFVLHGKQFFAKTDKGNRVKHIQIKQGTCEEDAPTGEQKKLYPPPYIPQLLQVSGK